MMVTLAVRAAVADLQLLPKWILAGEILFANRPDSPRPRQPLAGASSSVNSRPCNRRIPRVRYRLGLTRRTCGDSVCWTDLWPADDLKGAAASGSSAINGMMLVIAAESTPGRCASRSSSGGRTPARCLCRRTCRPGSHDADAGLRQEDRGSDHILRDESQRQTSQSHQSCAAATRRRSATARRARSRRQPAHRENISDGGWRRRGRSFAQSFLSRGARGL